MTLKQGLKIRILPGRKGNRRILGRRNSMSRGQEKCKGSRGKESWPPRDQVREGNGPGETCLQPGVLHPPVGLPGGTPCCEAGAAGLGGLGRILANRASSMCQLHALSLTGPLLWG